MTTEAWIAIAGVAATVIVGVVSWFVSAHIAKKSIEQRRLTYRMSVEPLLRKSLSDAGELQIHYRDELLPKPFLLSVDVTNTGNIAIENPPIRINAPGATYCIPRLIEDPPPGYEDIWELEREDGEVCLIKAHHINPGQTLRARFLLDEDPRGLPAFECPMPNLEIKQTIGAESRLTFTQLFFAALAGVDVTVRASNHHYEAPSVKRH